MNAKCAKSNKSKWTIHKNELKLYAIDPAISLIQVIKQGVDPLTQAVVRLLKCNFYTHAIWINDDSLSHVNVVSALLAYNSYVTCPKYYQ